MHAEQQMQAALKAVEPAEIPSYEQVKQARLAAHRALLRVVVQIFASYPTQSSEDIRDRDALLAPIIEASEHRRAQLRRGSANDAASGGAQPSA